MRSVVPLYLVALLSRYIKAQHRPHPQKSAAIVLWVNCSDWLAAEFELDICRHFINADFIHSKCQDKLRLRVYSYKRAIHMSCIEC